MANHTQPLRRSQFIYTYGPGAIIESKNGPRLIPSLLYGLQSHWGEKQLSAMQINDVRLCQYIGKTTNDSKKCKIFAIPSNSSLSLAESKPVYKTQIFPEWNICYNKKNHPNPILYKGSTCPVCNKSEHSGVVRFVSACTDGHLDDIDWPYAVHGKNSDCPHIFEWIAAGSSLASIQIKCKKCGKSVTMQEIYNMPHRCTGRQPEIECAQSPDNFFSAYLTTARRDHKCDKPMKIVQRQSTNLRLSDIITLLTIPEYDDKISNILQLPKIRDNIETLVFLAKENNWTDDFKESQIVSTLEYSLKISPESLEVIRDYINNNGIRGFLEKYNQFEASGNTFIDIINEEYSSLVNGRGMSGSCHFKMGSSIPYNKITALIPRLDICPVSKIRTVTAQRGYRRPVSNTDIPKLISVAEKKDEVYWFPGFEGFGEGVFINFESAALNSIPKGLAYNGWKNFQPDFKKVNTDWNEICTKPEFVWLHTLSHAFIRAISEFTGYSVASIHERVYYNPAQNTGGILLYNTTPGDDGGMGGLTDITNSFQEIIHCAEQFIQICSNDPLCSDIRRTGDQINGAVCYGCLLISETSCEHGNRWLDRHLFLDGS